MADEPPSPRAEFFMAIAGPLVSLGIAIVCGVLALLSGKLGGSGRVVGARAWGISHRSTLFSCSSI